MALVSDPSTLAEPSKLTDRFWRSAQPRQITGQAAILAHDALNDRRALEGIERKAFLTDRHQSLRDRAAGFVLWHDRSGPAALQSVQGQHATRLQALAHIPPAACDQRKHQGGASALGKNTGRMKNYLAHIPQIRVCK